MLIIAHCGLKEVLGGAGLGGVIISKGYEMEIVGLLCATVYQNNPHEMRMIKEVCVSLGKPESCGCPQDIYLFIASAWSLCRFLWLGSASAELLDSIVKWRAGREVRLAMKPSNKLFGFNRLFWACHNRQHL